MIQLLEYIDPDCVTVGLWAPDKLATLRRLVDLVVESGSVGDRERLLEAILRREQIVTTGIGGGIAIPHADLPEIETPRLALAVLPEGVEFEALDEEPVHVVFLLLGTPKTPGLHMKILARIARLSKDPALVADLCRATEPVQALDALRAIEARH